MSLLLEMQKRFVSLTSDERVTLSCARHHYPQYQFLARCQCLLFSADGYDVVALGQALGVRSRTVYSWFNRWQSGGLAGLANAAGQGRRPILAAADEPLVVHAVRTNRQQLKEVTATLRQEQAKNFSTRTLRRFLKSVAGVGGASTTP